MNRSLVARQSPADSTRFRWLDVGFSGMWLVTLLFPATDLIFGDYTPAKKVIGVGALVLFILIYLCSFGKPQLIPVGSVVLRQVCWSLLLLPTVVIIFIIQGGEWAATLFIFICAFWIFADPHLWRGITVGIILAACYSVLLAVEGSEGSFIPLVSLGFIVFFRWMVFRSEERENLDRRLTLAQEQERIARDVHDVLGHSLTIINLKAELAQKLLEQNPSAAQAEMEQISSLSRTALAEVRATVTRLRQPDFAGELAAAQNSLTTAGISFEVPPPSLAQGLGTNATLFSWVLREAITNVIRHSNATFCSITLSPEKLTIIDNGRGSIASAGNGITGMRERVEASGGDFLLDATPQEFLQTHPAQQGYLGTRVEVSMAGTSAPQTPSSESTHEPH